MFISRKLVCVSWLVWSSFAYLHILPQSTLFFRIQTKNLNTFPSSINFYDVHNINAAVAQHTRHLVSLSLAAHDSAWHVTDNSRAGERLDRLSSSSAVRWHGTRTFRASDVSRPPGRGRVHIPTTLWSRHTNKTNQMKHFETRLTKI